MSSSSVPPTRRRFINSSIGIAAALSAAQSALGADAAKSTGKPAAASTTKPSLKKKPSVKSTSSSLDGANERMNVAVIGCGGRGSNHVDEWIGQSDFANIVALCDPDQSHLDQKSKKIEEEVGTAPKVHQDVRKLLEDKEIDVVSIATPNHWHTLASIWAIQAGKDVYVEKPCSHNISEGRRLIEFARAHNRVVLHGTQSRSFKQMRQAMQFLHDGHLGEIFLARGMCYKKRPSLGLCGGPQPIPKGLDYDLWCGPASNEPPHRNTKQYGPIHYEWHWFWEYGNGDIGNQGVHQMDIAAWGLNKRELPKRVQTIGGRFGYVDDGQTPNTQIAVLSWEDGGPEVIFEVRGLNSKNVPGTKSGVCNVFYGTEGTLVVNGYNDVVAYAPDGTKIQMPDYDTGVANNHFTTFIKGVKNRKVEYHHGEIEAGHVASGMCHMANASYRMGKKMPFSEADGSFGGDKAAYSTLMRLEEHLSSNGLELTETDYMLGPSLEFDPKAERFTNNDAANQFLTRKYREPFKVPDRVA